MNTKRLFKTGGLGERGFTLIEIVVSLTILIVIAGSAMLVVHNSSRAKTVGDNLSEAQQNARSAMNAIVADLRSCGYSIDSDTMVPIEVASDYRMTMVLDRDRNGTIGNGERITYFLDLDQGSQLAAKSENPYDYVLRRVVSSNTDTTAAPVSGSGEIVAYLITQRSTVTAGSKDVPIFSYLDGNGNNLIGTGNDPANSGYGHTVASADLGLPAGTGLDPNVATIGLNVVAETASKASNDGHYRRFALGSQVNPPNFYMDLVASFSVIDTSGSGDPGDSSYVPPDTTVTDTTEDEWLPPYEPPIRISTARVLSLDSQNLGELDSQEGSQTTTDYQIDKDLVLGTKAGSSNNLSVWWNGQPGKYTGDTYYSSAPNYYGTSSYDIQDIDIAGLDGHYSNDAVCAVKVSDTLGGFQIWFNQSGDPGRIGVGSGVTSPNAYYSAGSGQGLAVVAVDVDNDYDRDVVLGTRTASNAGKVEVWLNDGTGFFTQSAVITASGEVNDLAALDFDGDGYQDLVAGTKTSTNDKKGKVEVFHNSGGSFYSYAVYTSGGKVNAVGAADVNEDGHVDIIAGTKTGNNAGQIEYWQGSGYGFSKMDQVSADGPVLCLDIGYLDLDNHLDIAAGNESKSIQAWFLDPGSDPDILPSAESWADAYAGGDVHAVRIIKVETGAGSTAVDKLYDIVIGTAVSPTEGEIVIYLNPYVWTLLP